MGLSQQPDKTDRRLMAWYLYDWANSAYVTTVAVTLLPAWFSQGIVAAEQVRTPFGYLAPESLWALANAGAAAAVFLVAPFLSAVADLSRSRRWFLISFAALGASATFGLSFMGRSMVWETLLLFGISQVGFVSANIFYDSFLPLICGRKRLDEVSSRGYGLGYIGGGLNLLLAAVMLYFHKELGLSREGAVKAGIALAALWWALFSIPAARWLKDDGGLDGAVSPVEAVKMAGSRLAASASMLVHKPLLIRFLLAFLLYNEGIQTVIQMAAIYGRQALGLSTAFLTGTLLAVQALAAVGAYGFSRLASRISALPAICAGLVIWIAIIFYAGLFLNGARDYLMLALAIGLVLGGTQALSRSLFASMIPPEASAEYFSFYSVISKFAAITGPMLFALSREYSGSIRIALLSTLFFFISGLLLLVSCQSGKKSF